MRRLTDDEFRHTIQLLEEYEGNKTKTAAHLGIDRKTLRERLARASSLGLAGVKPVMPGFEITKVTITRDEEGNALGDTITQKPEHGDVFEMPGTHFLGKMTVQRDAEGRVVQDWIRAMPDAHAREAAFRAVVDALKEELPRLAPLPAPVHANKLLLNQYTITDLHLGMLAWGEETGGADYDLKIGEKLLMDWFSAAIVTAPQAQVGILAQLGDFMHHDSFESVTPQHRNQLDADSRLQKIIRAAIRCVRRIVDMLLMKHPQVHIIMADANHDPASSAWLRELLWVLYENEPRITVENSPDKYYAYEWGKTVLFYHHGHRKKIKDVDTVFAGKFREAYGRCPKAYGHIGHLHNDESKDSNLMKVERHRTLAPGDAYSAGGGWLSERDAKVITYHREFGEVGRITLSPEMVQGAVA